MRAQYVIEETARVSDTCEALTKGDYERVGANMFLTHERYEPLV